MKKMSKKELFWIYKAHALVTADTSHKGSDEVVKGLTYDELLEMLRNVRNFIDSELFLQGK